ncbi:MAG: hypothetical protein MJ211_15540 [Bacteroidales bacterium]|nr:hypothetical protein [Bacteroidales bacterium]
MARPCYQNISVDSLTLNETSQVVSKLIVYTGLSESVQRKVDAMKEPYEYYKKQRAKEATTRATNVLTSYRNSCNTAFEGLMGAIKLGKSSADVKKNQAAIIVGEDIKKKSSYFVSKNEDTLENVRNLVSKLIKIDVSYFVTINAKEFLDKLVEITNDYANKSKDKTTIKTSGDSAVENAKKQLVKLIKQLYNQLLVSNDDGNDEDFIKAFNQIFKEIATSRKKSKGHNDNETEI